MSTNNLLTKSEVCAELGGVGLGFVNNLIAKKKLPVVKLGYRTLRVERSAVSHYISTRTVGRQSPAVVGLA